MTSERVRRPDDGGRRDAVELVEVRDDRGRVLVDDDRAVAVRAQHLERLTAGVVELAGLPDHDRSRADQADRAEILTPRQGAPARPTWRGAAVRRAGPDPPRDGTA